MSEGRRSQVIDRLVSAATSIAGIHLLNLHSDVDHNRSVLTLAGEAQPLGAALLAVFATALDAIDLRRHEGIHPRAGAVDVTPFVPLAGATMSDAVAAAHTLGAEVARRFSLPVYYYEEAALDPARRALPDIRRGGFEGFSRKILQPGWSPDEGPEEVHPSAGVAILGARFFLIAFNVVLATAEVSIARAVARAVRGACGGLPAVRAIGVYLRSRNRAQVSMNLLDYRQTSIARAFSAVSAQARTLGAEIESCEIVGLVPEAAAPSPQDGVPLILRSEQILERRLREVGLA